MEVKTDPSTSTALTHQTAQSPPRRPGSSGSAAHDAGVPAHPALATRSATAGPPPPRSARPARPAPPRQGEGAAPRRFEASSLHSDLQPLLAIQDRPAPERPQPTGAVFSTEGRIVVRHLAEVLDHMADLLPCPAIRDTIAQTEYRQLQQQLAAMSRPLNQSTADEMNAGLALSRDFADLAARAGKLAQHDGIHRRLWRDTAAMFNELKRLHLTFAAPGLLKRHADAEFAAVEVCAHGLDQKLGGSIVETSIGASLGVSVPGNVFSVSAGGGRGTTLLADDNRQTQFYEYQALSVGAAASLPGAELSLSVGARLGGTYLQSANFESMVKARVNKQANSSLTERLLRHTAAQHPRDAEYKARGLGVAFRRFLLGRGYRPASSGPTFLSDAKLAKGYNTTKLHLLAEELDRHSGHEVPAWQALIVSAYPAPADVVRHCVENQAPLPPETPINRSVPSVTAQGSGMLPYREITTPFGVTLGATGPKGLDGFAQVLMGFEASVRHNYRQFNLHECRHAHEFLDPALLGDFRATLALVQQIDQQIEGSNGNSPRVPARLTLYAATRQALAGGTVDDVSPHAETFGSSPPAQLRAAIAAPSEAALQATQAVLGRIGQLALDLISAGATVLARPDRHLNARTAGHLSTQRQAAYEQINERIWGGACPKSCAQVLDQPEEFVARSHDAISLALGLAGVHLAVLKQQLAGAPQPPRQAMDTADASYATARELLDKGFLPLTKGRLARSAALKSTGQWKGHAGIVRSRLVGPGSLDVIGALGAAAGISTGSASISNQVAAAGLTAEVSASVESRNVDASRLGRFVQVKVTADTGAPYLGEAMVVLLKRAIEWAWPGVTTQDVDMATRDVVHQLQGLVMAMTTGAVLALKLRRAPDTAGLNLQTARLIAATRSGGPSATGVVPAGVVNLKIGAFAADNTLEHALEVMGTDLGIHLLQFGKLRPVIEALREAPDDVNRLRRSFEANPGLIACYFANAGLVPTLIDRFLACRNDTAWTAQPGQALPNEFYRYFRTEPFQRIAGKMDDTRRHAPGAATRPTASQQPAALSRWLAEPPDAALWNGLKAHIALLRNPEQRFNFYVGSAGGREALRMFCDILETTHRINEAAERHVRQQGQRVHPFGYSMRLREAVLEPGRGEPILPDWSQAPA